MRWFKHIASSRNDESLSVLLDEFGLEGYGFWWMTLEIIAEKVDEKGTHFASYSTKKWCSFYGIPPKKFKKLVEFCANGENFPSGKPLLFVEENGKTITISCPNILKYRDEWTRKKSKTQEKLRSNSEVASESLRSKETETETDTDTETDTEYRDNNLPSLLTTFGEKVVNSQAVDPPDSISEAEPGEPEPESESKAEKDSTRQRSTVPYQQIIDTYNRILPELPKSKGGKEVRKHIRARCRESPERQNITWWEQYFRLVRDQPFLLGDNDRSWTANLEWLVRPRNMEKVLEMHYRSSTRARDPTADKFVRQGRISATTASNIVAVKEWLKRDSDEGDRQEKG